MDIRDEKELKALIRRIAEQVIRRLVEPEMIEEGALVLAPSYVPDAAPMREYLKEKYGENVTCAGEGAAALGLKTVGIDTQQDKQQVMGSLKNYAALVLAAPPLWMLKNIAAGDDKGYIEQVFMRALLWGKNTELVLDFEKPGFSRGTFFEGLNDALGVIEEMGAKAVSLKLSVGKPEGELALVTEAEIVDAQREGRERIRCAAGAIVTPLARDTAKELGVLIDE